MLTPLFDHFVNDRPATAGIVPILRSGVTSADPRHESDCSRPAAAVFPNTVVYRIHVRAVGRP